MADETLAQIGSGVALAYWNVAASPDVYANLGPIRSISDYGVDLPEVESTTLDSVAVERIAGLPDGSMFSVTFTTATTSASLIRGFVTAKTPLDLRITVPAPLGETQYLTVTPLGWSQSSITPDGLMEITLKGRITADVTTVNPHA